jgi:Lar family restriction alleviation protein
MTTITLLPCPHCQGKARITEKRRGGYSRVGSYFQGLCGTCFARGPLMKDEGAAIVAWNKRPTPDTAGARNAALDEAIGAAMNESAHWTSESNERAHTAISWVIKAIGGLKTA